VRYLERLNKKLDKAFGGSVEAGEKNGLLMLSGELPLWKDVISACNMAVDKKRYAGLVNDIRCTGESAAPPRMPAFEDEVLNGDAPDVLVVGGGVIGCAIARELSRYKLDVLLVDKEHDLAMHTSGRNDGMVHSGVDLKKGSSKYAYTMQGNRMFGEVCAELGVDFERCGQYICFDRRTWIPAMFFSRLYWKWLGLHGVRVVRKKELHKLEPVAPSIATALFFPATGLVCPYDLTIAYAENAVQNGARVLFDTVVRDIETENGTIISVSTNRGTIYPKVVVNAAGVFCEDVAKMAGDRFYSIHPRKGTNAILDRKYGDAIVRTAISSFGTADTRKTHTKGGGIIRTIDGNVLIGPDAAETIEKEDFSTTRQSVASTIKRQGHTSPALAEHQVITYFSGLRSCTFEEDFVVSKGKFVKNMVHAAGIQSPGLTAAPAIGVDAARMVVEILGGEVSGGEGAVVLDSKFNPVRVPPPRAADMDLTQRAELIARNPDYGVIVCRCEEVSKGEILDALRRNVPCDTIDGVKRRVRPGTGRCQGGFCGPLVLDIIAKEKGLEHRQVKKSGHGSEILLGEL